MKEDLKQDLKEIARSMWHQFCTEPGCQVLAAACGLLIIMLFAG
jgi:hypothetical protein